MHIMFPINTAGSSHSTGVTLDIYFVAAASLLLLLFFSSVSSVFIPQLSLQLTRRASHSLNSTVTNFPPRIPFPPHTHAFNDGPPLHWVVI